MTGAGPHDGVGARSVSSVNVRNAMSLLVCVSAAAPAIGGAEAALSLEPENLLQREESTLNAAAVAPLDIRLMDLRLRPREDGAPEPTVTPSHLGPDEFTLGVAASTLTLSTKDAGGAWLESDSAAYFDDDALSQIIEGERREAFDFGPSVRLHFDRPTSLRDGGIGGSNTSFENAQSEDRFYGFENSQGQFDLYDISLRWNALSPGPVSFSLIGGVKAVSTDVTEGIAEYDSRGNHVSTRAEDEYRMVPVPIVGGSFRWDVGETFYFEGTAQTHTIPDGNTLLDFTAETGFDFSPTVGLRAGYTYVRTAVELDQFDARLTQSGVFARVQISF